jgi:hypothetical protein
MAFRFKKTAAVASFAALVLAGPAASLAREGHWQPPGIRPAAVSLDDVLSAAAAAAGRPEAAYAQRTESWTLQTGPATLHTIVTVRDADLRFATAIDGADYEQGREGGIRWRRTPNGLVRKIASDVQGDDLDRWPLAFFPYAASDCFLLGSSAEGDAWVVEYRPAHDSPHWFFVDKSTGRLTREMFREGSRNVAFSFSDFRVVDGARRPFAWHVSGAGGDADVAVDAILPQLVTAEAVAIPASRTDSLGQFGSATTAVPATFDDVRAFRRIIIVATVNGHRARFLYDTGTTQILIDEDAARRFGLQQTLRHAIVRELTTGPVRFQNVAVQLVRLGEFGADGILGYEYFAGQVMHLDYRTARIEFIPSVDFEPPRNAREIAATFDEGMPLIRARIGSIETDRVVIDTGSPNILLMHELFEHSPLEPRNSIVGSEGAVALTHFLEGEVAVAEAHAPTIDFAGFRLLDNDVGVEEPDRGDSVDFPIDAIFGTNLLAKFEWWFDYDGGRIWLRPV